MDNDLVDAIRKRYKTVLSKISDAAARSGRDPQAIKIIVVTKAQPLHVVQSAVSADMRIFGENYAEEAIGKIIALTSESEVEWHMLGHVQSRKAELVAKHFNMLHSLDSYKLAARIDHSCSQMNKKLPVLLEFNVSGEESKFGWPAWDERQWKDLISEVERINQFSYIKICGLMTMPPYFEDSEKSRPYFQRLRRLQEYLDENIPTIEWRELSIGTSADYEVAVEEGATYVRIGQAILGPRPMM